MHRIPVLVSAALLLSTGAASAQIGDLGGTLLYVDTAANTATFSNGRVVHYDPQWRILVNGREVAVTEDEPGAILAVAGPTRTVAAPVPAVVASFEKSTMTMTLEDGRVVKLNEVQVWRQERLEDLRPGSQVYVSPTAPSVSGQPASLQTIPSTTEPSVWSADREVRGRVTRVTSQGSQIVLSDGRSFVVSPSSTVRTVTPQNVALNELSPGDDVVVQVQKIVPVLGMDVTPTDRRYMTTDGQYVGSDVRTSTRDGRFVDATGRPVVSENRYAAANGRYAVDGRYVTSDGRSVTADEPRSRQDGSLIAPSYRYPGSDKVASGRVVIIRYPQAP